MGAAGVCGNTVAMVAAVGRVCGALNRTATPGADSAQTDQDGAPAADAAQPVTAGPIQRTLVVAVHIAKARKRDGTLVNHPAEHRA